MLQVDGEIYLRGKIQDELIIHLPFDPKLWWHRLYRSERHRHQDPVIMGVSVSLHLYCLLFCILNVYQMHGV